MSNNMGRRKNSENSLEQYETRKQKEVKDGAKLSKEQKTRLKKFILIFIIPLTIVGLVGIALYAVGQATASTVLMIVGGTLMGLGFVPTLTWAIIIAFKRGIPVWW